MASPHHALLGCGCLVWNYETSPRNADTETANLPSVCGSICDQSNDQKISIVSRTPHIYACNLSRHERLRICPGWIEEVMELEQSVESLLEQPVESLLERPVESLLERPSTRFASRSTTR